MSFALLPPEVNSSRMYAGPGAAPLTAAASAWAELAAMLGSTAADISTVVAGLTATWRGPSAIQMATTLGSYQQWLLSMAQVADQTATQAQAAAAAFTTAFAATIPPPVVAANRTLLASLTATNFLGLNTPAIMATEAHYLEMWAQDAAAMLDYQAASQAVQRFLPQSFSDLTAGAQTLMALATVMFMPMAAVMDEGLWGSPPWQSSSSSSSDPQVPALASYVERPVVQMGGATPVGRLSAPPAWGRSVSAQFNEIEQAAPLNGEDAGDFAGFPGVLGGASQEKAEPARYGFRANKVIPRNPSAG